MSATERSVSPQPASLVQRVLQTCRAIIGAPDYAAYLQHIAEVHPDRVPLTESEFLDERLQSKYSRPGSRCC